MRIADFSTGVIADKNTEKPLNRIRPHIRLLRSAAVPLTVIENNNVRQIKISETVRTRFVCHINVKRKRFHPKQNVETADVHYTSVRFI